jgi:hypothetical protein
MYSIRHGDHRRSGSGTAALLGGIAADRPMIEQPEIQGIGVGGVRARVGLAAVKPADTSPGGWAA